MLKAHMIIDKIGIDKSSFDVQGNGSRYFFLFLASGDSDVQIPCRHIGGAGSSKHPFVPGGHL